MAFSEKGNQHEVQELQPHTGLTPRELVLRQIKEYNYHVTEEDIENMDISLELPDKHKQVY